MKTFIYSSLLLLCMAGCQTTSSNSGQQNIKPKPKPWVWKCTQQGAEETALVAGKVSPGQYGLYFKADNGAGVVVESEPSVGEGLRKYLNSNHYVLVKTQVSAHTTGGALTGDPDKDVIRYNEHYQLQSVLKADDKPILPSHHKALCNN